jgi:hypothetical protein
MPLAARVALAVLLAAISACSDKDPTVSTTINPLSMPSGNDDDDDDDDDGDPSPTGDPVTSGPDTSGTTGEPDPTTGGPTSDPSTTAGPTSDPSSTTTDATSDPGPFCGDGQADPGEDCDGGDLDGYGCIDFGSPGGSLACRDDCTFDTGQCEASSCNNGVIDVEELCDCGGDTCTPAELDQATCYDFLAPDDEYYKGGALKCGADCTTYDFSDCQYCGDGVIAGNEQCDGDNLNGFTCESFGYSGGALACVPLDCTYDVDDCF